MLPSRETSKFQRQRYIQSKRVLNNSPGNNFHRNGGIAILISDKIDFKITKLTREKMNVL